LNWLDAAASFSKRIYLNRMIPRLPLPRKCRGGRGRNDPRIATTSQAPEIHQQYRVGEHEAVSLYAKAMLPARPASARLRQLF
jgi:hypothetical protein